MEKVSPQVRILALVLVLAGAAGLLALRMLGPSVPEETAVPTATRTAAKPRPAAKPKPAPATKATPKPAAKATPKPAAKPPVNAPEPAVPATGFPVQVDRALRRNDVLVVSLVVPGARVDELAAAEAAAGAKLGGAGYLALDVLDEKVARALLTKLDTLQDPTVLVLRRSGEVALALDGFVDRQTVAQAAANAAP